VSGVSTVRNPRSAPEQTHSCRTEGLVTDYEAPLLRHPRRPLLDDGSRIRRLPEPHRMIARPAVRPTVEVREALPVLARGVYKAVAKSGVPFWFSVNSEGKSMFAATASHDVEAHVARAYICLGLRDALNRDDPTRSCDDVASVPASVAVLPFARPLHAREAAASRRTPPR
jgi:hypothetical protein